MELEFLILISTILFFAALIHGSTGFGFPMISTPLLAFSVDIQTAIIYTLIPTLLVNIVSISTEGNFLHAFKRFWPLATYAGLGSIIGTLFLIGFNSDFFKLLLAFAILSYLIIDMIKIELIWIRKIPRLSQAIFGVSAGLLGGLTNAMGPVLMIYTLESKFTKKEIIQASNICFLVGKIFQIMLFSFASLFTFKEIGISSIGLVSVGLALFIGVKIKGLINPILYKKIVKIILLVISITLIIKYIF